MGGDLEGATVGTARHTGKGGHHGLGAADAGRWRGKAVAGDRLGQVTDQTLLHIIVVGQHVVVGGVVIVVVVAALEEGLDFARATVESRAVR